MTRGRGKGCAGLPHCHASKCACKVHGGSIVRLSTEERLFPKTRSVLTCREKPLCTSRLLSTQTFVFLGAYLPSVLNTQTGLVSKRGGVD